MTNNERIEHTEDRVAAAILRAPFARRTWREGGYLLVSSMLGFLGATYLFLGAVFGLSLVIVLIGIPLIAAVIVGARSWGVAYRVLSETMLSTPVTAPPPFRARGISGSIAAGLTDRVGWRAVLFLVIQSMLSVVNVFAVLMFAVISAFLVVSPVVWAVVKPVSYDADGVARQSLIQIDQTYFDTLPQMLALAVVGICGLFVAPWPIRAMAAVERTLIGLLLAASDEDRRVSDLETSRAEVVDNSTATLRRVERDLHDGTQARLVTMAMALGRAEEKLARGEDASELVSAAHGTAKDALVELREVVRGIHPPALDLGLEAALQTLCSRSPIPVELTVLLPYRPGQSIETIAYFTVAELLTNAAKHSHASQVWVDAHADIASVVISVRDNGIGGAVLGAGTGLKGLQARVESVDGALHVDSPVGGPTVVKAHLPLTSGGIGS